ncbi:hypothetical protein EMIT047CA2_50223 [Pseudomonas soli]
MLGLPGADALFVGRRWLGGLRPGRIDSKRAESKHPPGPRPNFSAVASGHTLATVERFPCEHPFALALPGREQPVEAMTVSLELGHGQPHSKPTPTGAAQPDSRRSG